jgi:hypothetical protein
VRTFVLLLVFGTAAAVVSAAQSASPKSTAQPLSIIIVPERSEVKAGADVYVKIRSTNTSHHDIPPRGVLYAQGVDTSYQYDCRDATGKSVAKKLVTADGSIHETPVFGAGASREETFLLSRGL